MSTDKQSQIEVAMLRLWGEFSEDLFRTGRFDLQLSADTFLRLEVVRDPLGRTMTPTERDVIDVLSRAIDGLTGKQIVRAIADLTGEERSLSSVYKSCANLGSAGLLTNLHGCDGYHLTSRMNAALDGNPVETKESLCPR